MPHKTEILVNTLKANNYNVASYNDQIYAEHQSGKSTVIWHFRDGITAKTLEERSYFEVEVLNAPHGAKIITALNNYTPESFEDGMARLSVLGFLNTVVTE